MHGTTGTGGMSRRSFVMGASAVFGAAALGGLLGGCSSSGSSSQASSQTVRTSDGSVLEFDCFDSDILLIGAGNAATAAAWSLARDGHYTINVVDKGPRYNSGHTNTSWVGFNVIGSVEPDVPLSEYTAAWLGKPFAQYLINTQLMRNALNMYAEGGRDRDEYIRAVTMINHGQYLVSRDETGALIPFAGTMGLRQAFRFELQEFMKRTASTVYYDRTMITELIFDGDTCCGAIGLHIPTGRLRVFRAKATIVATSGCYSNYGFAGTHAYSAGSMDNTFDVEMSVYRHGMGIAETEFVQYDIMGIEPSPTACSVGGSVLVDAQKAGALYHEDGTPVFSADDKQVNDRNYFSVAVGKVIEEEGAVYIDGRNNPDELYASVMTNKALNAFGYDLSTDRFQAGPDLYEHGGAPLVDENLMTEKKGLFWTRGAGTYGECGGSCLFENHIFGNYAGHMAAQYVNKMDAAPSFDTSVISDEYSRLVSLRNEDAKDGIRPHVIHHEIQDAFYKAFGPYRPTDVLESSISELERIRTEELPNQSVSDMSMIWNKEWKEAIENVNLLANAEMSLKATLTREESRGGYMRPEFPDQDDENWRCMLVCKDDNGEMTFEKSYLPDPVD